MNKVLMTAIIVLPLVMFLAYFSENIASTFKDSAGDAHSAGETLKETVGDSGWGS